MISTFGAKSQDPHFSQFYASPLYTNPALAGTVVCPRASVIYRNQWPSINYAFRTFAASYDQYFDILAGGIGIMVMSDAESKFFTTNMAALMYSLRLKLTDDIFLNLAVQGSFTNRSLDWTALTFGDQIDPRYGFLNTVSNAVKPSDLSSTYFDVAAGFVFYGEEWYAGFSAHNITQPNTGLSSLNNIPIRFTGHAGMNFNISRDKRRTNAFFGAPVISPNVIYDYQNGMHKLNIGLYLDWSPFIVGTWFRHPLTAYEGVSAEPDAVVVLFGAQWEQFKIGYSYDITISSLANASGGAHEISASYLFPCPEKRKKVKSIRCPSF